MRKFKYKGAVKFTDNESKARELLRLGYVEVEGAKAPNFDVQVVEEPRTGEEEGVVVEKGLHTIQEPTTDKVEAGAVVAEEEKVEDAKKDSKKKDTKKK